MSMAEREQAHRHLEESIASKHNTRLVYYDRLEAGAATLFSAIFVGALIWVGYMLAVVNHDWVAGSIFMTTIGAVAYAYRKNKAAS